MVQYLYKGFKVFYRVKPLESDSKLYQADGHVICDVDQKDSPLCQKFHTEYPTLMGVENEIKKLLENYIDFEWLEFKEMDTDEIKINQEPNMKKNKETQKIKPKKESSKNKKDKESKQLDKELLDTFPASDPVNKY